MPEDQGRIPVSYLLSEILMHTQRRCTHHGEDKKSIHIQDYVLDKEEQCILYACIVKARMREGREGQRQLGPNEVAAVVRGMIEKKKPGFTNTTKWQHWFPRHMVDGWRSGSMRGINLPAIGKTFEKKPD